MPVNTKDDDIINKKSFHSTPQTIGSRKNGFPAVIIIHQITNNSNSFHRKKDSKSSIDIVDKDTPISSPKLEEIPYIDESEVTVDNGEAKLCQR